MPEIILVLPGQSVELSPTASGFAHGFGLFETMHYSGGCLDSWPDHWARLSQSAEAFGLLVPGEGDVLEALRRLVSKADLTEAVLKLSLLREADDSRLFVYARPSLPAPESDCLWLDREAPIFERSSLAGHKTHNYMEPLHRLQLARERGYCDALRLDSRGHLAETTSANVFFLHRGRLCTPALETGCLPGVTRAALLRHADLEVETGCYPLEVLQEAEALVQTNASMGVRPIRALEGLPAGGRIDFDPRHPAMKQMVAAYLGSRDRIRLR